MGRIRRYVIGTAALAAVVAMPAAAIAKRSPAVSGSLVGACPAGAALSSPFLPWGDAATYFLVNGGSFEGASGWTLGGSASIVADNESFHIVGASDGHALEIGGGGTVTSPAMCADGTMPSMRMFIRRMSGTGMLRVSASVVGSGGPSVDLGVVDATPAWAPSTPLIVDEAIVRAVSASGPLNVRLTFRADAGTVFRIDDVYVDPYRRA